MEYSHLTPCKCKLIRFCLGWSQEELAEAAQCSPSTVSSFEDCGIIGFDMRIDLDDALIKTGRVKIYSDGFRFMEEPAPWEL